MSGLLDALVSTTSRKLSLRKRNDISARKQYYQGRTYWVVKEPLGLKYYRFQEEEYAILQMLDGTTSLDDIKERFEEDFPPQKITLEELHNFLGMLHKSGLVVSAVPGQAKELLKRRGERTRQEVLAALTNILCFRFKGIDPERLLGRMHKYWAWFFSGTAVFFSVAVALSALTLVLVEFQVFQSKLPEFYQFFNLYNGMWLTLVLALTKILHEFGHGLSCKHFGGECHEMGVMILVLTPCLYCNVSDSWMLPNKWHRMYIGAAGMYVEMILASVCTFIWWFTSPGLVNMLCLNVMFVSSVSTLIFNGNPLLRYDGYYILADYLEIPNLRQKATQVLSRKMGEWCMGLEQPEDPFLPKRNQITFALFSIASAIYRWVVVISILLFLNKVWKPYKLEVIGYFMGLLTMYGLFVYPLYRLGKFFYVPGRLDKMKKWRLYTSIAVVVALLATILFLPLPYTVMCTLEVQARDANPVYVDVPGLLQRADVIAGEQVTQGQSIAQLDSIDLRLKIQELLAHRDQYGMQLENLQQQRFRDPKAGAEIPQMRQVLKSVEEQLAEKQRDLVRLHLVAPAAGTILPPPLVKRHDDPEGGQLPTWSGLTLERENLGAYLEAGVLFCQVGDPVKMEAILVIDQSDVELVQEKQTVDVKLVELPHEVLTSAIVRVANIDLKVTPQRLSSKAGGELQSKVDPNSGVERPMSTSYQARVPLDDPQGLLRIGLRGQGKIHVAPQTLARRVWRFVTHTFNFKV